MAFRATWRLLCAVAFGIELEVAALLWLRDVSDRRLGVYEAPTERLALPSHIVGFVLLVTLSSFHVCQMHLLPACCILVLQVGVSKYSWVEGSKRTTPLRDR